MRDRTASCLAAAAALAAAAPVFAGPLRPVALTGTSGPLGPNLGPAVTFSNFVLVKTVHPEFGTFLPAAPCISGSGSIVFGANLAGAGISAANGSAIYASRGGPSLSRVARRGDPIPGMAAGYTFGELFTPPQVCDANTVVFQSMIDGPDVTITSDEGTFTERSGWVLPVVLEGRTLVPETGGQGVFGLGPSNPGGDPWGNNQWVMNRHGDMALRCFVNAPSTGTNSGFGVYTDFGGPLSKHYRGGDTGSDGASTYTFSGSSNPRLNDSGAFMTLRLSDLAGLQPWTNRAKDAGGFGIPGTGPLHTLFTPNQTVAPGTSSTFSSTWSLRDFHLNANGRVAFAADLAGGGPGAQGGFWSDARFGALQLVALSSNAAPDTGGAVFNFNAQFVLGSALSDNNCVILHARLLQSAGVGGGNDTGLWTTRTTAGQPGNLRLLVREGSPVPANAPPDYQGLNFGEFSQFWVNASGRTAFITLHNDFTRAVWVEQADGSLTPVVKEFTTLDIFGNGSDVRLIAELDVANNNTASGAGLRTAFNDSRDIALRIKFADGSEGIFTTAPAVPCAPPAQVTAPLSQSVAPGDPVTLAVEASGTGPLRHQWRFNGTPIFNALGPTLTVESFSADDAGWYECLLSNACGTIVSSSAQLTVGVQCTADFDCDGDIGTDADIEAFFACLAGNCPAAPCTNSADYDQDGDVGTDADIEAFFRVLAGGDC